MKVFVAVVGGDYKIDARVFPTLEYSMKNAGIEWQFDAFARNAVERTQDEACYQFLKTDCTHLYLLHQDKFPSKRLGEFWAKDGNDYDVVFAWTPSRNKPYVPQIYQFEWSSENNRYEPKFPFFSCEEVFNAKQRYFFHLFSNPAGALIKRWVIERYPTWHYGWDSITLKQPGGGEDIWKCRQWFLDPEISHILRLDNILEHFDSNYSLPFVFDVKLSDYLETMHVFTDEARERVLKKYAS